MAEIKEISYVGWSDIYGVPSVYFRFGSAEVDSTEEDNHFLVDGYEYCVNYQFDFLNRSKIIGIEIVNVQDFLDDPKSTELLQVDFDYHYERFQGDLKSLINYIAEKEKEEVSV